jgi:hypothetical protein
VRLPASGLQKPHRGAGGHKLNCIGGFAATLWHVRDTPNILDTQSIGEVSAYAEATRWAAGEAALSTWSASSLCRT